MQPTLLRSSPTAVVVDGFYEKPDEVRAFALAQTFQENRNLHKGQRSQQRFLFPGVKALFEDLLRLKITKWEGHGFNGVFQFCVGGDQVVFHSDGQTHAGVVYLTPDAPPEAGTTLYRSRRTKGRTVAESARLTKAPPALCEQHMYAGKLLDRTAWEVVDVFGNVYNRLVLWDARVVHSASCYFGTGKENGRLFQMFFFDTE